MKLELELTEIGCGRVVLDGHDISQKIRALTIRARVGEITSVSLEYLPVSGWANFADVDVEIGS